MGRDRARASQAVIGTFLVTLRSAWTILAESIIAGSIATLSLGNVAPHLALSVVVVDLFVGRLLCLVDRVVKLFHG